MIAVVIFTLPEVAAVRPRLDWMTRADNYILELLDDAKIAANPATISYNVDYDRSYVSRRCRHLGDAGLLNREDPDRAMYRITDLGCRYLTGDLTDDEEERLHELEVC